MRPEPNTVGSVIDLVMGKKVVRLARIVSHAAAQVALC